MSARARQYEAQVLRRDPLFPHLLRLTLGGAGLSGFASTGLPDEWVGLVVPGQFQSRYYTVRRWDPTGADGPELVLDVVVHDVGLVTEWATRDCVGDTVTITEARGSFAMPRDSRWLMLVGDLTALPAMARITETCRSVPVRVWAEVPDDPVGYLPEGVDVTWLRPPADGRSALADVVAGVDWPEDAGYFWMAGESAQMRAIRKHLMRQRNLPSTAYDVMGYWRSNARRQLREVDPGPVWRAGRAAGRSEDEIWAAYDAAREGQP